MNIVPLRSAEPQDAAATSVRWRVVALLAVMAGLTYVDRLNMGIVGKYIQDDYHLSTQTLGWVLSSFSLGYAIFHVPGGWLADRFGPRSILALSILWFSAFTILTAAAPQLPLVGWWGAAWSFAIVRFLMGTGEAAAIPVGNKLMAFWLGQQERAFGTSVFLAGVGAGGVVTPVLIVWITRQWGWRASFWLTGLVGVVVALVSYFYITNKPEEHAGLNEAELAVIRRGRLPRAVKVRQRSVPWRKLLSNRSVWALMISHFCLVYPVYIFVTWFFIYLVRVRHVTIPQAGLWTSAPFLANLIMVPLWGWLTDWLAVQLGKRNGRKVSVWLGAGCSAALLYCGSHTAGNSLAILELAVGAGFNFAASAVLYSSCNDIAESYSGSLSGVMATFGSLGGWLSPILTAYIAVRFGWTMALDFAALVTLASAAAWLFIDADVPLDPA